MCKNKPLSINPKSLLSPASVYSNALSPWAASRTAMDACPRLRVRKTHEAPAHSSNLCWASNGGKPLPNIRKLVLQVDQIHVLRDLHHGPYPVRDLHSLVQFGSPDIHRSLMRFRKCTYLPRGAAKGIETIKGGLYHFVLLSGFAGYLFESQPL
jgi:hypothetical protein